MDLTIFQRLSDIIHSDDEFETDEYYRSAKGEQKLLADEVEIDRKQLQQRVMTDGRNFFATGYTGTTFVDEQQGVNIENIKPQNYINTGYTGPMRLSPERQKAATKFDNPKPDVNKTILTKKITHNIEDVLPHKKAETKGFMNIIKKLL